MTSYPTLTQDIQFPFSETIRRDIIEWDSDGGYNQVIARNSRRRKVFSFNYINLPYEDYQTLETFYETTLNGGIDIFQWTHPKTSTVYNVRFSNNPFSGDQPELNSLVDISIVLNEV